MDRRPVRVARDALRRLRRIERREAAEVRDWLEHTRNLLHLSVLVALPLLIALVTYLSNAIDLLPFLLFPPLAAGTYTLFAHPESRYASPRRFVGGLTAGALCGWIALAVAARFWYRVPPSTFDVHPGAAAFAVFLTGAVTWGLDVEESSAFSTALLVLVTGVTQLVYVVSVAASTAIIAGAFVLWRRHVYEQRARYLYRSTSGDDRVLVPMRGPRAGATAMLAGRLAAAHEAGEVVLLDVVSGEDVAAVERAMLAAADGRPAGDDRVGPDAIPADRPPGTDAAGLLAAPGGGRSAEDAPEDQSPRDLAEERLAEEAVHDLTRRASRIEASVDVPCEVIVAVEGSDRAGTVLEAAQSANCDLIAVPMSPAERFTSGFAREVMRGEVDVLLHRSVEGREAWRRVLVPVRRAGDVAHAMIDFAARLADRGRVSVCHCIATERERRSAEEMLANLVETVPQGLETRVARANIEDYLVRTAPDYDLVVVGASTDRSAASRLLAPPTAERLADLDADVAVVHRGRG